MSSSPAWITWRTARRRRRPTRDAAPFGPDKVYGPDVVDRALVDAQDHGLAAAVALHVVEAPGHDRGELVDEGRLEDLLRLAVKGDKPALTGAIEFHTKFDLPHGKGDLADYAALFAELSSIAPGDYYQPLVLAPEQKKELLKASSNCNQRVFRMCPATQLPLLAT